jgi:hypothetical protein
MQRSAPRESIASLRRPNFARDVRAIVSARWTEASRQTRHGINTNDDCTALAGKHKSLNLETERDRDMHFPELITRRPKATLPFLPRL